MADKEGEPPIPPPSWYRDNMGCHIDRWLAYGFQLHPEDYNKTKGKIEKHLHQIKPPHENFKGNKSDKKRLSANKLVEMVPELSRAPKTWRESVSGHLLLEAKHRIRRRKNHQVAVDETPKIGTPLSTEQELFTVSQPELRYAGTPFALTGLATSTSTIASATPCKLEEMWIEVKSDGPYTKVINLPDILDEAWGTVSLSKLKAKLNAPCYLLQKIDGSKIELVGTNALNYELAAHAKNGRPCVTVFKSGSLDPTPTPTLQNSPISIEHDALPNVNVAVPHSDDYGDDMLAGAPVGRGISGPNASQADSGGTREMVVSSDSDSPSPGYTTADDGNLDNTTTSLDDNQSLFFEYEVSDSDSASDIDGDSDGDGDGNGSDGDLKIQPYSKQRLIDALDSQEVEDDEDGMDVDRLDQGLRGDIEDGMDDDTLNPLRGDSQDDIEESMDIDTYDFPGQNPEDGEPLEEFGELKALDKNDDHNLAVSEQDDKYIQEFKARFHRAVLRDLEPEFARITPNMVMLVQRYFPLIDIGTFALSDVALELPNWGLNPTFRINGYQLAFVVWAFQRELGKAPGGILADEAGAGKTVEMIALFLMNYWYSRTWWLVQIARRRNDGRHLPPNAPLGSKCPTANRRPLACVCEPENKDLYPEGEPPRGVTILITPNAGLNSFRTDATKMLKDGKIMTLNHRPRIAIHAEEYDKDPLTGQLSEAEMGRISTRADWTEAEQYEREHRSFKVNRDTRTQDWNPPTFKGPITTELSATTQHPSEKSTSVMIITTRGFKKTRLDDLFEVTRYGTWQASARSHVHHNDWVALVLLVRRIIWDEYQLDTRGETMEEFIKTSAESYQNAYGRNPSLWAVSGAPDNGNPFDVLLILTRALRNNQWTIIPTDQSPDDELHVLNKLEEGNVWKCIKDFERLCLMAKTNVSDAQEDAVYSELVDFVRKALQVFQIRRTSRTLWYDRKQVIQKNSRLQLRWIAAEPQEEEKEHVTQLEVKCALGAASDPNKQPSALSELQLESYFTARAAANVSQLVQVWEKKTANEPGRKSCTLSNSLISHWVSNPRAQSFSRFVASMVEVNAKFKEGFKILDTIKVTRRLDGTRCKVLICTRNPLTLASWINALEKRYGADCVLVYSSSLSSKQKIEIKARFDRLTTPWIMICTFASMGVALNVQRANHAIMIEPSYKFSELKQYFARVDRRGQTEPVCYGYILRNTASEIEEQMMAVLAFEQEMQSELYEKQANASVSDGNSSHNG